MPSIELQNADLAFTQAAVRYAAAATYALAGAPFVETPRPVLETMEALAVAALKLHDLMPLHERERILAMQPMRPCPHHPPEGRIEGP